MPKVSEMIVSKYLRKEDVDDDVVVTIADVTLEDMPGDEGQKRWVLHFREFKKGLVLNSTSIRTLEKGFGGDTGMWIGGKVTLYVDPNVSFRGQIVGGLRLRPVRPKVAVRATPIAQEDLNDKIPA